MPAHPIRRGALAGVAECIRAAHPPNELASLAGTRSGLTTVVLAALLHGGTGALLLAAGALVLIGGITGVVAAGWYRHRARGPLSPRRPSHNFPGEEPPAHTAPAARASRRHERAPR